MSFPDPKAQLKHAENLTWMADREVRLQSLTSTTRALWHELNGRDAMGEEIRYVDPLQATQAYKERNERMAEAVRQFDALPSTERRATADRRHCAALRGS